MPGDRAFLSLFLTVVGPLRAVGAVADHRIPIRGHDGPFPYARAQARPARSTKHALFGNRYEHGRTGCRPAAPATPESALHLVL
ncbi:hypothetical protein GCM10027612_52830 [Microbispora bryophytorum subsp. camponoti]